MLHPLGLALFPERFAFRALLGRQPWRRAVRAARAYADIGARPYRGRHPTPRKSTFLHAIDRSARPWVVGSHCRVGQQDEHKSGDQVLQHQMPFGLGSLGRGTSLHPPTSPPWTPILVLAGRHQSENARILRGSLEQRLAPCRSEEAHQPGERGRWASEKTGDPPSRWCRPLLNASSSEVVSRCLSPLLRRLSNKTPAPSTVYFAAMLTSSLSFTAMLVSALSFTARWPL